MGWGFWSLRVVSYDKLVLQQTVGPKDPLVLPMKTVGPKDPLDVSEEMICAKSLFKFV